MGMVQCTCAKWQWRGPRGGQQCEVWGLYDWPLISESPVSRHQYHKQLECMDTTQGRWLWCQYTSCSGYSNHNLLCTLAHGRSFSQSYKGIWLGNSCMGMGMCSSPCCQPAWWKDLKTGMFLLSVELSLMPHDRSPCRVFICDPSSKQKSGPLSSQHMDLNQGLTTMWPC